MNFIKKGLLTFGVTAALTGAFAVSNIETAEAAAWEARTVEEVRADIQSNGVESRYTIQWGDTLGTIANALDLSVDQIVDMNAIANRDLIIAGNILHLSAETETVSIEDNVTHEVQTFEIQEPATEPVVEEVVEEAPVEEIVEEVVEETVEEVVAEAPVQSPAPAASETPVTPSASGSEAEAKAWIAYKESTDNYNARNGQYIGKYQLASAYLNGDHSPENQERVAEEYVASRYGSWSAAKAFWLQNGWY